MYEERKSNCSERISTALAIRRMKQADLCARTKIPKSAMSQYISGAFEPKQDRIYLIAKALGVSEAWLMGYDVPMERQDGKKSPSDKVELTEGEQMWLELYHRLSDDTRKLLINTMGAFDRLPKDKQKLALDMIRVALGDRG